jgi:hypothetical protein
MYYIIIIHFKKKILKINHIHISKHAISDPGHNLFQLLGVEIYWGRRARHGEIGEILGRT